MWAAVAQIGATLIGGAMSSSANNHAARVAAESQRYATDVAAESQRYATEVASNAQREAANLIAQGQYEAAKIYVEATNKQLDLLERALVEVENGNMAALEHLRSMRIETAPAMVYMRETMENDGRLNEQQQYALEQLRNATQSTISSSGFAGSGRTAAALFRNVETDFVNRAMESNRDRAFSAASTLAGNHMQTGNQIANIQAGQGVQKANLFGQQGQVIQQGAGAVAGTQTASANAQGGALQSIGNMQAQGAINTGNAQAQGAINTGNANANAATANAEVWGKSIGDIGSVIANQQRESKFQDRMSSYEKSIRLKGDRKP